MPQVTGSDAVLFAAMGGIDNDGDRQMHFAGMRLGRGGDRVKPRRNLVQEREKLRNGELDRILGQDVREVAGENIIVERFFIANDLGELRLGFALEQLFQDGLDEFLAHAVDAVDRNQQIAQRNRTRRLVHRCGAIKT